MVVNPIHVQKWRYAAARVSYAICVSNMSVEHPAYNDNYSIIVHKLAFSHNHSQSASIINLTKFLLSIYL